MNGTFSTTRWIFSVPDGEEFCLNNLIELLQPMPCYPGSSDSCGAYLMAANNDPGEGSTCTTSTLTISAQPKLNNLQVECRDMSQDFRVGNTSVIIVGKR